MAITPPPSPPNSGNPQTFNEDADAFLGWMAVFGAELSAQLPALLYKSWATYGGTANAITLTAGYSAGPAPAGLLVRFRASVANTGAATIALDDLGAKPCVTATGTPLPAGYIRTDVDTIARYDGTKWTVFREMERGSNANGNYFRDETGAQWCYSLVPSSNTADAIWTFPAAFIDPGSVPTLTAISDVPASPVIASITATTVTFNVYSSSGARLARAVRAGAIGRWY